MNEPKAHGSPTRPRRLTKGSSSRLRKMKQPKLHAAMTRREIDRRFEEIRKQLAAGA